MTASKKKRKCWNASPAACLMPQLRADVAKRRGHRSGKFYESDSPGKLYTYVSAGNIEMPNSEFLNEPVVKRGMRPIVLLASLLILIWFVF